MLKQSVKVLASVYLASTTEQGPFIHCWFKKLKTFTQNGSLVFIVHNVSDNTPTLTKHFLLC